MKIAFASDASYPWFKGGIEKRRYLIIKELVAKGHDVHVFTMRSPGMPSRDFEYEGATYHCCGTAPSTYAMYSKGRRDIPKPISYAAIVFFRMLGSRFEIIDADSFPFLHIPLLWLYAKLTRAKFVVTWHEVWDAKYWRQYLGTVKGTIGYAVEKLCAAVSSNMIANSESTRDRLVSVFGKKANEIPILPAAISAAEIDAYLSRSRSHSARKQKQFIMVGRLIKEKRFDMGISAINDVNANLAIVGVGDQKAKLVSLARAKARGKVSFTENLARYDLFDRISGSAALLMLSAREGLSLITLEALSLGTPVLIVKSTSLPGNIRRFCIEVDDSKLGQAMRDIIALPKRYAAGAARSRGIVMNAFSTRRSVAIYKKIRER